MKTTNENFSEFEYLLEKLSNASFTNEPFKHLIIDDFLSEEHFEIIKSSKEVSRPIFEKTEDLIDDLKKQGYDIQPFPGCTNSVKEYLACFNKNEWPTDKDLLEGFGLTFRLKKYQTPLIERLMKFLKSEEFKLVLNNKLELKEDNYMETGVQKYLHGYEISPHPDSRSKAATFMLNINTDAESEQYDIHTYLLKFKPERMYVNKFWKSNIDVDRCWVPWNWCTELSKTVQNNSIVIFSPSDDSLHAVKLNYDHLKFQRTQVYGNLWYFDNETKFTTTYKDLSQNPIDLKKIKQPNIKSIIKTFVPLYIRKKIRNTLEKKL